MKKSKTTTTGPRRATRAAAPGIKTEWDLKGLLYRSLDDSKFARDLASARRAALRFEKKYARRADWLANPAKLRDALRDYERLYTVLFDCPASWYLHLRLAKSSADAKARARLNIVTDELVKLGNRTLFFTLRLAKIPSARQKKFLAAALLAPYRHFLKQVFERGKYNLTEPEEQLENLLSVPGWAMWKRGLEKLVSAQTVRFRGKEMPFEEAHNLQSLVPTNERRALGKTLMAALKDNAAEFGESAMNALLAYKKTMDELRGFKTPDAARIVSNENSEASVRNLADTITKKFSVSHRFSRLRAKMLNLSHLEYADRVAKVGTLRQKFSFTDAVRITREAFEEFDPEFRVLLDDFLANGRIDAFPEKGKHGGAFCSSIHGHSSMILLNSTPTLRAVTTLAHEMGHAIHFEFSRKCQSPLESFPMIAIAEVASTLFENTVFDKIFAGLSDREKIIALHDKINDSIATVFRQITFFNFERDMHERFRAEGYLSHESLGALLNDHTSRYLGPAYRLDPLDGYFFIQVSHFRNPFYVYAYAYGELISKAMYARWKADPSYVKELKQFLSAGGGTRPDELFKSIGIDTARPDFWNEGIANIEADIAELERLIRTSGKPKKKKK